MSGNKWISNAGLVFILFLLMAYYFLVVHWNYSSTAIISQQITCQDISNQVEFSRNDITTLFGDIFDDGHDGFLPGVAHVVGEIAAHLFLHGHHPDGTQFLLKSDQTNIV